MTIHSTLLEQESSSTDQIVLSVRIMKKSLIRIQYFVSNLSSGPTLFEGSGI